MNEVEVFGTTAGDAARFPFWILPHPSFCCHGLITELVHVRHLYLFILEIVNCIESTDSISSPTNNRLTLAHEHRGRGGHVTHLRVALAVDHNPSVAKGRHYVCADVLCFRDTHVYIFVTC
jgi:hypothetical protein